LDEFRNTPSSELTIEDFQNIWLEETCDPPSFSNARKKGKRKRSHESEYEKDYEAEELKKEINDILKGDEIKELAGKIDSMYIELILCLCIYIYIYLFFFFFFFFFFIFFFIRYI